MLQVEIKRTPEGKLLARRADGNPLTPEDMEEARILAQVDDSLPCRAWIAGEIRDKEGHLQAVKVCSEPLQDHLWLILDKSFTPHDSLAQYYPEELPQLRKKSLEELREIHKVKLAFPGCRVIQEGPNACV